MADPENQKKQSRLAVALICVLAGLLFSPWIFTGRVLAPFDIIHQMFLPWRVGVELPDVKNHFVTDAVTQYIPYRIFAEQSFREDGYVGWNPLVFGGTPQYANTMALSFDWTIQLHRILPFWNAWHLGIYLQLVLAGAGMFLFLRSCGCAPPIALMGALAYMTNWQFVAWIYHRWALGSFCWMPWAFWAMSPWFNTARSTRDPSSRTPVRFSLVPVFLALAFMGGSLQHSAFVVMATVCVFLGCWWDSQRRTQALASHLTRFFVWGALGMALAGIMFEPTIRAFLDNNASGHMRGALGYENGRAQPLLNALSYPFYLFPFPLGSPSSLDFWKVLFSDMFNIGFFGTVPMVLALLSLFKNKVPTAPKLLIIAGLILPLTPLVGPLYHRVNLLWILGGCWAAAELIEISTEAAMVSAARKILWCLMLFGGLWLFAGSVFWAVHVHTSTLMSNEILLRAESSQFGFFKDWLVLRTQRAASWILLTNPIQFTALGLAFLSAWGLRFIKKRSLLSFAAALAVFMQTSIFWWIWTTWSDPRDGYSLPASTSIIDTLRQSPRLVQENAKMKYMSFPLNTIGVLGIETTGGYDSIHPFGMNTLAGSDWDFPGAAYYLGPAGHPGPPDWIPLGAQLGGKIFKNPSPQPIFSAMISTPTVPIDARTSPGVAASPTAFKPVGLAPVTSTFNKIVLDIPPATAEVWVLNNWNSGWKFRVGENGAWQSVRMAENRSMIIPLAQSSDPRRLTLQFFRFTSLIGPCSSLLAALLLIAILLGGWRKWATAA